MTCATSAFRNRATPGRSSHQPRKNTIRSQLAPIFRGTGKSSYQGTPSLPLQKPRWVSTALHKTFALSLPFLLIPVPCCGAWANVCFRAVVEHDTSSGEIAGAHEVYGNMDGQIQEGVLTLTPEGCLLAGSEPEPERDNGTDAHLRCEAQVFPSADNTRWIIVGEWHNIPQPVGATEAKAPIKAAFLGHMKAGVPGPAA